MGQMGPNFWPSDMTPRQVWPYLLGRRAAVKELYAVLLPNNDTASCNVSSHMKDYKTWKNRENSLWGFWTSPVMGSFPSNSSSQSGNFSNNKSAGDWLCV